MRSPDAPIDLAPRGGVLFTADAASRGIDNELRGAARRGELIRLRRGAFVDPATWNTALPEVKHLLRVVAVANTRDETVFTGYSAAVLHGLPIMGSIPSEVHVLSATHVGGKNRNGVVEHYRRGDEQIVHAGLHLATSVAQTIIEVSRTASFATGVCAADAALHVDRRGEIHPLATMADLRMAYAQRLPFPGSRKVKRVLEFATPHADSPLESLSRVAIHEMGFPAPTLQHRMFLPRSGRWIYLDMAWLEYNLFGEADGFGKYLGDQPLGTVSVTDRIRAEKRRENEVRALGHGMARWEMPDARDRAPLRAILLEAGLPILNAKAAAARSRHASTR